MKKSILLIAALVVVTMASAQIEVKINPVGALFGSPDVAAEYFVSDNFGAELTLGLVSGSAGLANSLNDWDPKRSGFGVMGMGKYYFSPDEGCDKFFAALYLRQRSWKVDDKNSDDYPGFSRSIFAGGFALGYKWVGDSGIMLEIAGGAGRAFSEKNEWLNVDNQGIEFPNLGLDAITRLAVGYRF